MVKELNEKRREVVLELVERGREVVLLELGE